MSDIPATALQEATVRSPVLRKEWNTPRLLDLAKADLPPDLVDGLAALAARGTDTPGKPNTRPDGD